MHDRAAERRAASAPPHFYEHASRCGGCGPAGARACGRGLRQLDKPTSRGCEAQLVQAGGALAVRTDTGHGHVVLHRQAQQGEEGGLAAQPQRAGQAGRAPTVVLGVRPGKLALREGAVKIRGAQLCPGRHTAGCTLNSYCNKRTGPQEVGRPGRGWQAATGMQ
jgi:hypothetical protein